MQTQRQYPKAPVGRRLLAHLFDTFIALGPMIVVALVMPFVDDRAGTPSGAIVVAFIAAGLWALYYSFTKDGRDGGKSIGKNALDLMVVHVGTNTPCTAGQSAMRTLIMGLMNVVPLVGWIIEPLMVLVNEQGRRVGDMAAGTQVIETRLYNTAVETARRAA